ncbi:carbonic anhydrase-related protein 10-like isoform X1 [Homarus americanus]|uniref:carbonic anhydrase-related protein 10-like isoform X1 n=1 Tax=Homarus americanus TaxID=6706 RepID=UPI001C47E4DE|nr:carbonic anhydrase-related protein 10-like isoform X1 [Homarus americanus]XP_042236803.1 carbonic anhydrase-related protein 10-like isoform X1 [Homarus americanus]
MARDLTLLDVTIFMFFLTLHLTLADHNKEGDETEFDWSSWWSYDGISGPGFWGIINRRWKLCSDGRRQSPVDLATSSIVFDHTLSSLALASHKVDGTLTNTGFGLRWSVDTGQVWQVSEGPIHYAYTLTHAVLRWSNAARTTHTVGSEHSIQGQMFPAEIQLYLYNSDLYNNFTHALDKPNGVLGVAVLLKIGWRPNPVLKIWMDHIHMVPHRGTSTLIPFVPIRELFTSHLYLSYEGSLTEPPCEETVTWIILNKPGYITADQLWQLQSLRRGTHGQALPISGNFRPLQPLHRRAIRTNIPPYTLSCSAVNRTNLYQAMDLTGT